MRRPGRGQRQRSGAAVPHPHDQHNQKESSNSACYATLYTKKRIQFYPSAAYRDIISGTNLYYNASAGYDPATGLGTPDAWNIARDLAVFIPMDDRYVGVRMRRTPTYLSSIVYCHLSATFCCVNA
ncbi:hypothetical protein KDH_61740 [Dictyobacter sp. S3.2.2.5]|uniref:Uncharacterized protein n=1 Tax=Dictyobacter halimunensis TaxID=3026934 RepID=A0ABQ6G0A7_9CHLR|nr:hypothetical protein KDH_61740 [Dictyobacter sp. S3.2.2.5]